MTFLGILKKYMSLSTVLGITKAGDVKMSGNETRTNIVTLDGVRYTGGFSSFDDFRVYRQGLRYGGTDKDYEAIRLTGDKVGWGRLWIRVGEDGTASISEVAVDLSNAGTDLDGIIFRGIDFTFCKSFKWLLLDDVTSGSLH
jgi:hypothetical protein